MSRKRIYLPRRHRLLAEEVGRARSANKVPRFGGKVLGQRQSSEEVHIIGALGEMAVAYHFGTEIDREIYDGRGDDGTDVEIPGYGKVQVKTTTYGQEPWLRVEAHRPHVDAYFLVYVNPACRKETVIIGVAPLALVLTKKPKRIARFGPMNHVVKPGELSGV